MRNIIYIALFLTYCTTTFADVYVLYKKDTKEVLSISKRDDAVVPANYEKTILPGDISQFQLQYDVQDYKFIGNKFIVNTQKQTANENAKAAAVSRAEDEVLIRNKALKMACDQLVAEGVKLNVIKCSDFGK